MSTTSRLTSPPQWQPAVRYLNFRGRNPPPASQSLVFLDTAWNSGQKKTLTHTDVQLMNEQHTETQAGTVWKVKHTWMLFSPGSFKDFIFLSLAYSDTIHSFLLIRGAEEFSDWFIVVSVSTVPRHVLGSPLVASIHCQLPVFQTIWWKYMWQHIRYLGGYWFDQFIKLKESWHVIANELFFIWLKLQHLNSIFIFFCVMHSVCFFLNEQ